MVNNVAMWEEMAKCLGLRTERNPGDEVEITNPDDPDCGILWVAKLDMLKIEPGDIGVRTIDAVEALAVLGRLQRGLRP